MANIMEEIEGQPAEDWKLITLTLKHSSAPLKIQHAYLRKCFRQLRQRAIWKSAVAYGWAVIETTWNAEEKHWHPHLHVLAQCRFIPQAKLSLQWCQITKGSKIVDIRLVESQDGAVRYVTDYIAKAPKLGNLNDPFAQLADYYHAIDGAKLLITFGPHPDPKSEPEPEPIENDWIAIAPLAAVLESARSGDTTSVEILLSLERKPTREPHTPPNPPP